MTGAVVAGMWISTGVGVLLGLAALVQWGPPRVVFGLAGFAELAVLIGIVADVVVLARGHQPPDLATHVSYLLSVPLFIPLGVALTYKKLDRWGLLIISVACLLTAVLVLRQIQTLVIPSA